MAPRKQRSKGKSTLATAKIKERIQKIGDEKTKQVLLKMLSTQGQFDDFQNHPLNTYSKMLSLKDMVQNLVLDQKDASPKGTGITKGRPGRKDQQNKPLTPDTLRHVFQKVVRQVADEKQFLEDSAREDPRVSDLYTASLMQAGQIYEQMCSILPEDETEKLLSYIEGKIPGFKTDYIDLPRSLTVDSIIIDHPYKPGIKTADSEALNRIVEMASHYGPGFVSQDFLIDCLKTLCTQSPGFKDQGAIQKLSSLILVRATRSPNPRDEKNKLMTTLSSSTKFTVVGGISFNQSEAIVTNFQNGLRDLAQDNAMPKALRQDAEDRKFYNKGGYDQYGLNQKGYDEYGYKNGYNEDGYDSNGFDRFGLTNELKVESSTDDDYEIVEINYGALEAMSSNDLMALTEANLPFILYYQDEANISGLVKIISESVPSTSAIPQKNNIMIELLDKLSQSPRLSDNPYKADFLSLAIQINPQINESGEKVAQTLLESLLEDIDQPETLDNLIRISIDDPDQMAMLLSEVVETVLINFISEYRKGLATPATLTRLEQCLTLADNVKNPPENLQEYTDESNPLMLLSEDHIKGIAMALSSQNSLENNTPAYNALESLLGMDTVQMTNFVATLKRPVSDESVNRVIKLLKRPVSDESVNRVIKLLKGESPHDHEVADDESISNESDNGSIIDKSDNEERNPSLRGM